MGAINRLSTALAISSLSLAMFGCSGQNSGSSVPPTSSATMANTSSQYAIERTPIDTLYIADPALNSCIINTDRQYIEEINTLSCNNKGIESLEGIEQLTALHSLFLNFNDIQDLTPLTGLNNLLTLYLAGNLIQDISALSQLNNLTELAIQKNEIQDISPLESLTGLESLYTRGNTIYDFSPLDSLNLKVLAGVGQQES